MKKLSKERMLNLEIVKGSDEEELFGKREGRKLTRTSKDKKGEHSVKLG